MTFSCTKQSGATTAPKMISPKARIGGRANLAACGLAASLALTACGGSSATSAGGAASGSSGATASSGSNARGSKVGVTLILKTLTNPYFVAMQKDAEVEAKKDNVDLHVAAGKSDGDTQTQITEIGNAVARGDKGILILTNGDAVNAALRQAKQAGLFVIALDTPPNPPSVADVTYATDNEQAGRLIGQYAAAKLNGQKATIAMLDVFNNQVISTDVKRDHGFLEGMGINPGNPNINGKEAKTGHYTGGKGGEYQIVCHQPSQGAIDGGRTGMENCLGANGNINVVYTINEPTAAGALQALQAAGKKGVLVVTIDGSCHYVNGAVKQGSIAADSAQYPGKMAVEGVRAVAQLARGGAKPTLPPGKDFINTGTTLVTANPVPGVPSQTPAEAAKTCWG